MKGLPERILPLLAFVLFAGCSPKPLEPVTDAISASPSSFTAVSHEGSTLTINVDANCGYRLTLTDDEGKSAFWLKADKTSGSSSGTVQVTVGANPDPTPRRGSVNIIGDAVSAFVDIYQQANPSVGPDPTPGPEPAYKGYYSLPFYEEFRSPLGLDVPSGAVVMMDPNFSNITISGNRLTFDGGLVIDKTGADAKFQMACPVHVNPKYMAGFQLGINAAFSEGDAWIVKIPMAEELWGDLRFSYDSRNENITTADPYSWSSDGGATWHPVINMQAMRSEAACKSIWFTIPETMKVEAGDALWIKIVPERTAARLPSGMALTWAEAPKSKLAPEDKDHVVLSEGFDAIVGENASYLDAPGFLKSHTSGRTASNGQDGNPYAPSNAAIETVHCYGRPGFLQVGYYDEALIAYSGWNGRLTLNVGQRLKEMGLEKADLSVTFRAAGMTSVYGRPTDAKVILLSGETVVGRVEPLVPDQFTDFSFEVKDADRDTVLVLTSEKSTKPDEGKGDNPYVMADYRFFIDDIFITVKK